MRLILFFALAVLIFSCANPVEMVENQGEDGAVERFERRKSDAVRHGKYERFSRDGTLIERAYYQNDSLHGERTLYYPSGKVEITEQYKKGIFDGPFRRYYESGQLELEQPFKNGTMEGESIAYFPSGKIRERVTMQNNEENGPFIEYYENGNLKTEGFYANGDNETGILKEYDSTGVLIRIAECKEGVCNTTWEKEGTGKQ